MPTKFHPPARFGFPIALQQLLCLAALIVVAGNPEVCLGYVSNGRWSATATDGPAGPYGSPVTITWSIVPDGTPIAGGTSGLYGMMDALFGSAGIATLEQKPWFGVFEQAFDRWNILGGAEFVHEPNDDGVALGTQFGNVGVRGDVRIGAAPLFSPTGDPIAQIGYLDDADMTIDTAETTHFGDPAGDYAKFRNTIMHELGHALGLDHNNSGNAPPLMGTFYNPAIDGPQLDDIRGLHYLYGDFYEKSSGGAGNNTAATATPLGPLTADQALVLGADGVGNAFVEPSETDFVSIHNTADVDFYSFTINDPIEFDARLAPVGATYIERPVGGGTIVTQSSSIGDLSLTVFRATSGGLHSIAMADATGVGGTESILGLRLSQPGEYLLQVTGATNDVQTYELEIAAEASVPGDYNSDGVVDAADYAVWRNRVGTGDATADGSGSLAGVPDGVIDSQDYQWWRQHFGQSTGNHGTLGSAIPVAEPTCIVLGLASMAAIAGVVRPRRLLGSGQRQAPGAACRKSAKH